eukprot:gnl/TRDRNA2_/TRDRNA2_166874_c0_seq16.p1 gnl/TRDRNA2_/TRDRNA2_166874_c0~~gnl/TRDRNA2_/TRDRNA2_166874_c0_seq16.p1  ORF type:complete len:426 (-),score=56.57 gnl/TRDRNA2_/TRDRNA2_166874_c0_seq16:607-1884(-)
MTHNHVCAVSTILLLTCILQEQLEASAADYKTDKLVDKLINRADQSSLDLPHPSQSGPDATMLGKVAHAVTLSRTSSAIPCTRYGCHSTSNILSQSTARLSTPWMSPHGRSASYNTRCRPPMAGKKCDDIFEPIDGLYGAQMKIKRCEAANLAGAGSMIEVLFHVEGVRGNLPLLNDKEISMQLHWGAIGQSGSWEVPQSPPPNALPTSDGLAMRTTLSLDNRAVLKFPCDLAPSKIGLVLLVQTKGTRQWLKANGGSDFVVNVADALKLWQWQSNVPRAAPALPKVGGSQTSHLCSIEKAAPGEVTKLADLDEFMIAQQCDPDRIMVIMYYAAWCQTCKVTKHHVMRFAKQIPEVRFFEMDYGSNKDLCQSLGITKLPFMEMYAHGQGKLDSFVCMPRHLERLKLRLDYERKRMSGDVPKVIPR